MLVPLFPVPMSKSLGFVPLLSRSNYFQHLAFASAAALPLVSTVYWSGSSWPWELLPHQHQSQLPEAHRYLFGCFQLP